MAEAPRYWAPTERPPGRPCEMNHNRPDPGHVRSPCPSLRIEGAPIFRSVNFIGGPVTKSMSVLAPVFMAAVTLAAGSASVRADESADASFKLRGPIDAVSCSTTPPTVTVFGLVVDTTNAVFHVSGESEGDDEEQSSTPND